MLFENIKNYGDALATEFNQIPADRKLLLDKITQYIRAKHTENKPVRLVYICTHNSRRSQFGQVWAHVAADYYNVPGVQSFSGGTEATAVNINAVNTLRRIGFDIAVENEAGNPVYNIYFNNRKEPINCFSKEYTDPVNPQTAFAAIMTCSDAEENCPFIPGVELRAGTTYEDPKAFDNSTLQDFKYAECCRKIALETFYVFSKIKG